MSLLTAISICRPQQQEYFSPLTFTIGESRALGVLFLKARNPIPSESASYWDWPLVGTSKPSLLNSISPKTKIEVGTSVHFGFSCMQFLPFIIIMPFRTQPPLLRQMIQAYKCHNLISVQRKILESILH